MWRAVDPLTRAGIQIAEAQGWVDGLGYLALVGDHHNHLLRPRLEHYGLEVCHVFI